MNREQLILTRLEALEGELARAVSIASTTPAAVSRAWWVNPAIGNDSNDGTMNDAAHAMKTIAAVNQRLGMGRSPNLQGQLVTVNYVGLTCTEDIVVDAALGSTGTYLLQFHPQVVHSGTLSAGHINRAGPYAPGEDAITLTDNAGLDWTPFLVSAGFGSTLAYRVDITSGSAAGFSFYAFKNLGAGKVRASAPSQWQGNAGNPTDGNNQYAPTFPCTYNIVQLPYLSGAVVDAVSWGTALTNPSFPCSRFEIADAALATWLPLNPSVLANCFVDVLTPISPICYPVNVVVGGLFYCRAGNEADFFSGGFMNSIFICSGHASFDEMVQFEGITVQGDPQLPNGRAGLVAIHECGGFFDLPQAINVENARWALGGVGIYGNGNTTPIFQINDEREVSMTAGLSLATTTTAPVEVVWGIGAGATVSQARPYTAATDTLGALENTTFANISAKLAAGGYRRNGGGAIVVQE